MTVLRVIRFMAEDGREFDSLEAAERHDRTANLSRRISKDMSVHEMETWLGADRACQWPKDELFRQMKDKVGTMAMRLAHLRPHQVELIVELTDHFRGQK